MSKNGYTGKVEANGLSVSIHDQGLQLRWDHQGIKGLLQLCRTTAPKCGKMHIIELNRVKTLYIHSRSQGLIKMN
jgi:hypothetical protein